MFRKLVEFLKETRAELGKITWPTRGELRESTIVVIITVIIITIFIGAVDWVFSEAMKKFFQAI
jgi:preprotein translocase subunit SecE